jgi:hypothetical protein
MASVFNDIFGGGTTTSTPTNMNPLTSQLAPQLGTLASSYLSQGAPQYNGPLTVGTTTAQNTSLTNLANAVAPSNQVNSYIGNVLSGAYMPGGTQGNPYISASINAANQPIQNQLTNALKITNPSQAVAEGQQTQEGGSSAFQNSNNIAIQSAITAEQNNAAQISSNAYNTGVQQMTAAAQLQPQEVQSAINVLQAQLLPTLLQEQGITNGLTAFQDNVTALTSFLSTMSSLATPVVGNTSSGNTTSGILPDLTSLFKSGSNSGNSSSA